MEGNVRIGGEHHLLEEFGLPLSEVAADDQHLEEVVTVVRFVTRQFGPLH